MTKKDYMLYGTKILNLKTQEIGLLICIWKNKFADAKIDFATCVDRQVKDTISSLIILEVLKMILRNRRTRKTLEIEYSEFRKKFAREIHVTFESFRKTELNKSFYNYKDDNSIEFNFFFQFQWNFNNF